MERYHITIEYDGAHFHGWQKQNITPTVQEILQQAIFSYCQESVCVIGAGRTDAGVHALAQSAHVDLERSYTCKNFIRGVNAHLRFQKIVLRSCRKVEKTFHARFDALRRHYCYVVRCSLVPPALEKGRLWHMPLLLDLCAVEKAASLMEGQHDFSLFRSASCQARDAIRIMERVQIAAILSSQQQHIKIRFQARAFLQKQVRFLVGALVAIGKGKWLPKQLEIALQQGGKRGKETSHLWYPPPAPPHGLYLEKVDYAHLVT